MAKDQKTPEGDVKVDASARDVPTANLVKVRVLRDCQYGACNDVAEIDAALVKSMEGVVDADPAAVAYAESLSK